MESFVDMKKQIGKKKELQDFKELKNHKELTHFQDKMKAEISSFENNNSILNILW